MNENELENLISAWLDGWISQSDSDALQQVLIDDPKARARFRELSSLDSALRDLAHDNACSGSPPMVPSEQLSSAQAPNVIPTSGGFGASTWLQMMMVALALLLVGGVAYQLGRVDSPNAAVKSTPNLKTVATEKTISGHATLRHVAGMQWSAESAGYRQGDVLPKGRFEFEKGVAEIDFFCGATIVVEGPAKLDLESDWSVRLLGGRLRANVPPAARGFVVKAADSEIVDLGTEFALEVQSDHARVEVVDGEIKLRGGRHDGQHLLTGDARSLVGVGHENTSWDLSKVVDVQRREAEEQTKRFDQWKTAMAKLKDDRRLIAYYPVSESSSGRFLKNAAPTGVELDGKFVGQVNRGEGRFGEKSTGLGFARPGSRVRALIEGEFEAFSFACWARIDGLDHKYNALFMSDGYENGELHWQIDNDGRMMFSVMVDDTPGAGEGPAPDSRFHRIYYTDPIWDITHSGKWIHLAAVYDPVNRVVQQYLNGEQISSESIPDRFYVEELRIGPAEIGNWGQPLRKSPDFAVRNFNGAIDEMAIFSEALGADEINQLYESGKPSGY